jgi:hypothetical protein
MLLVGAILALLLADAARGDGGSDPEASPSDTLAGTPSIAAPARPVRSAGESEASEAPASSVAQTCTAGGATGTTVPDPDAGSPQPVDRWTAAPEAERAQPEPAVKAAPEPASQALAEEAAEAAAPETETEAAAVSPPSRADPAQPATETPSSSRATGCGGADAAAAAPAGDSNSPEGETGSAGTGDGASDEPDAPSESAEEREASADDSPSEPDTSSPEPEAGALDATETPPLESEIAGERDLAADALVAVLSPSTDEHSADEESFASPPRPRFVLLLWHAPRFALERRTRWWAAPGSLGRPPDRAEPRPARETGERVGGAPDQESPLLGDDPERPSSGSSTGLSSAVQSPTTPVGELLTLSPLVPLVGSSRRVPIEARPCHPLVERAADEKPG